MAAIYKRQVVLELISVVFLVLTVGVYSWLPQLRSLQSKCLVCLCASQAVAYSLLAMLQIREINSSISLGVCKLVGYSAYFWFLSTFFWTSVVSINLFLRVKFNDPPMLKKYKTKQSLMFAVYAIFAWSASLLLLLITITADHIEGGHLKSGIGTATCWINGNVETWAFFYGPVSFLIAVNVALFVATSIKLWSAAMTYERSALVILKRRFMLSLRLFLVMGVSWIFEIASYAHGGPHVVWAIADTFNYLLGVWFFILLVIRKPVLRALASKGVFGACGRRLFQKKVEHDVEDMLSDEESPREIQLNKFSKTSPI